MFLRGQIGPCPKWMAELDLTAETAAIEEKWIRTGKMLSWYMVPSGFRLIGPKFLGVGEEHGLSLWFYTCLLYTSPSPRDRQKSRMPSSA